MSHTAKGTKPDFHRAMGGEASKQFYKSFLARLGEQYAPDRIKGMPNAHTDGRFGAMMDVSLVNDGMYTTLKQAPSRSVRGATYAVIDSFDKNL